MNTLQKQQDGEILRSTCFSDGFNRLIRRLTKSRLVDARTRVVMLSKAISAEMQLVNLTEDDGRFNSTKIATAPTLATAHALGSPLGGT